jgi:hypothetical protein
MTIITIVDKEEDADIKLQLISFPSSSLTEINNKICKVLTPMLLLYLTEDINEIDVSNDGVCYIVNNNSDKSIDAIKDWNVTPKKVFFFEESFYNHSNAITYRPCSNIREAGWQFPKSLIARKRLDEKRKIFYQCRISKFSNYMPRRNIYKEELMPTTYVRTLMPCIISSEISQHNGIVIGILPPDTVVAVSKMCIFRELRPYYNDKRLKLRLRLSSSLVSNNNDIRMQDCRFGSDGWITYEIELNGDIINNNTIDDNTIWPHDDSEISNFDQDVQRLCEFIPKPAKSNSETSKFNPFPRLKFEVPYVFHSYKCATTDEKVWSTIRQAQPRYRCFQIFNGILTYYENNEARKNGENPLKGKRINLDNSLCIIRKPSEYRNISHVPTLNSVLLDYMIQVLKSKDRESSNTKIVSTIKNISSALFVAAKDKVLNTIGIEKERIETLPDSEILNLLDETFDLLYLSWNLTYDTEGSEVPELRNPRDNLIFIIEKDHAHTIANVFNYYGTSLERVIGIQTGDI